MNLTNISEIKPLMEKHGFSFSKSLGQNFLINKEIPVKIAENSLIDKDTTVLEIGPGIGCLTQELAKRAKRVIAVEIDKKLIPILEETLSEYENIQIINEDIMKLDFSVFGKEELVVCANLPYYITTPIIMYLLESALNLKSITVMIQKEVATRLCAKAGTQNAGAISLAVEYYSEPKLLFSVSSGSFMPVPKVDSSVVRLFIKKEKTAVKDQKLMFKLIKFGFSKRRKTLTNSLSDVYNKKIVVEALQKMQLKEDIRAERLTVEQFAQLSDILGK